MRTRLLNYFFSLAVIFILIVRGEGDDHLRLLIAILLAFVIAFGAFLLHYLTLEGAKSATVVGASAVAFGGWEAGLLLATFFIISSMFTTFKLLVPPASTHSSRRGGLQVWSNGFWYVLLLMIYYVLGSSFWLVASAGALAVSTADTWATELGSDRFKSKTVSIIGFRPVTPGVDGGISWVGSLAASVGSGFIALLSVYFFSLHLADFFIIFIAGLAGCFIDSYIGAVWQHRSFSFSRSLIGQFTVDNNLVNWLSAGSGALITILLILIF